ncbi:MAG: hypothetical protein KF841_04480 [Phycisphaerae bacterium]|nr:hypothetical protein [Phycisphaerae bacterium]
MVWWIDPAKDDAVVEVVLREIKSDGPLRNLNVVKNDYMRVDGRWWLKRSENTSITHGVVEVHTFHHAEFDRPDHPKSLGVETFNMPPGVQVADFRLAAQGIYGMDAMGRYLGGGVIVSEAEWREQIAPGFDMESLSQFKNAELAAHGHGQYPRWWGASDSTLGLDRVASDPDQWEAYVRRWILRHSHQVVVDLKAALPTTTLTAAQIESAWAILKDCRKRAEPVLRRKAKADSARAESAASAISQPSTAPAGDLRHDDGTASSVDRSEDRFDRELGKVFELLKSRLNGLLQSKQVHRKAAE